MKQKGYPTNDLKLFHGTRAGKEICRTGFKLSYANSGLLGKGMYFSNECSKSHGYK